VQQQSRNETGQQLPDINGRLVIRRVDELRAHPSYLRNGIAVSASQLSGLAARADAQSLPKLFQEVTARETADLRKAKPRRRLARTLASQVNHQDNGGDVCASAFRRLELFTPA